MSEHRSLLPPRNEICQRLTEVAREKKLLEQLLKLSVREEQDRQQQAQRPRHDGGVSCG
jgi:hypothetical protein